MSRIVPSFYSTLSLFKNFSLKDMSVGFNKGGVECDQLQALSRENHA